MCVSWNWMWLWTQPCRCLPGVLLPLKSVDDERFESVVCLLVGRGTIVRRSAPPATTASGKRRVNSSLLRPRAMLLDGSAACACKRSWSLFMKIFLHLLLRFSPFPVVHSSISSDLRFFFLFCGVLPSRIRTPFRGLNLCVDFLPHCCYTDKRRQVKKVAQCSCSPDPTHRCIPASCPSVSNILYIITAMHPIILKPIS